MIKKEKNLYITYIYLYRTTCDTFLTDFKKGGGSQFDCIFLCLIPHNIPNYLNTIKQAVNGACFEVFCCYLKLSSKSTNTTLSILNKHF